MRTKLFILFFFISISIQAQLSKHEVSYLSECLLVKVNALRVENNLKLLSSDSSLVLAAELHSNYMARVNRLSHRESSSKTRTPSLRVGKYATDFELVGENILFIENKKKKLKDELIESIADKMFNNWKNSPKHYANMIHSSYELSGFGFAQNKRGKLYATHVLGTKGIVITGQLSENAFGVKPYSKSCDGFVSRRKNFVINMGNALHIYGDKVEMYYHSKDLIEEMLPNEGDGLAIDIVYKDQFDTDAENILDFSPIYDGVMLKPMYRSEVLKNNTAEGEFRLVSQIATIPTNLLGKKMQANLIYIKDGNCCEYIYPVNIPSGSYSLVDIKPKISNPKQFPFLKWGIVDNETLYFDFDRGKTSPVRKHEMVNIEGKLKDVQIVCYSSIEGDSLINLNLRTERASYIKNYLTKMLKKDKLVASVKTNENWSTLDFQLELLGLDSLKSKSHNELREFVATDTIHNWDSLLYVQRRSYATISYEGKLNASDSLYFEQNFTTAVSQGKIGLANRALAEIYKSGCANLFVFNPTEFEFIIAEPRLVQNTAAILSESYGYDFEKSVLFIRHWLKHEEELNADAKYNLCILYCKVVSEILDSWDVEKKVFAKIVSPTKIESMVSEFMGDENHNKLMLNYHLTAIDYYGQNNNKQGLKASFSFIESYFKKMILSIEDEIALCLFFNSWSRYDLTIKHLYARMQKKGFNEDAAFILAKTGMAYSASLTEEMRIKIMNRAFQFNKKRWCKWINNEFQILRHKEVKEVFCKECKE